MTPHVNLILGAARCRISPVTDMKTGMESSTDCALVTWPTGNTRGNAEVICQPMREVVTDFLKEGWQIIEKFESVHGVQGEPAT